MPEMAELLYEHTWPQMDSAHRLRHQTDILRLCLLKVSLYTLEICVIQLVEYREPHFKGDIQKSALLPKHTGTQKAYCAAGQILFSCKGSFTI